MNFYRAFARTLLWRPGLALAALWWHLTGRRVRARNRLRLGRAQSSRAYRVWMRTVEAKLPPPEPHRAPQAATGAAAPLISVILHYLPGERPGQLERVIAALEAQSFASWELVLVAGWESPPLRNFAVPRLMLTPGRAHNPGQALMLGAKAATGAFVLPLPKGAILPRHALARYAEALAAHRDADMAEADVIYADHDDVNPRGRRTHPWFKPAWDPDMFLAQDYLSQACIIRAEAVRRALPVHPSLNEVAVYAALLTVTGAGSVPEPATLRVVHIPHVLAHLPPADSHRFQATREAAVARHLAGTGATARAGAFGTVRVEWPLPEPADCPLVSIVIPTRDQPGLLRACVLGVLSATRYPRFEVIIVDNGSTDPAALAYLARVARNPRVRVLRDDGPFNFAALNNRAVREARGTYLCLLNNDIEIIDETWLTALMRQAVRPGVGAVGAKLLYADGSLQHAGVVIGINGAAGHAHRFQKDGAEGYFAQAHFARQASAVTAACLVVEKAKFEAVNGLDEAGFAVAFNDVDLCLKLRAAGLRNIYEPAARLIHHESRSRPRDSRPDQAARFARELALLQQRWATAGYRDPLHHPHLEPMSETYVLRL